MRPPAPSVASAPAVNGWRAWVRLIRLPNLLLIMAAQCMVRMFLVRGHFEWPERHFVFILLSSFCVAAAGYMINDYYDAKIDAINRPQRLTVGLALRRRHVMLAHTLLNVLGIALGAWISLRMGIAAFLIGFLSWLYSNQLKRLPLIGNLTVGIVLAAPLWVVGWLYGSTHALIGITALVAFYMTALRSLLKDIADMRGDMHFGSRTLPIIWGIRRTKSLIYASVVPFLISVLLMVHWAQHLVAAGIFVLFLSALGYFLYRLYWADRRQQYEDLIGLLKWLMGLGIACIATL